MSKLPIVHKSIKIMTQQVIAIDRFKNYAQHNLNSLMRERNIMMPCTGLTNWRISKSTAKEYEMDKYCSLAFLIAWDKKERSSYWDFESKATEDNCKTNRIQLL